VRQLRGRLLGCQQPDTGGLLLARLRQHELGAALEAKAERRGLRALLACLQVAQPAGGHQVDEQDELAVLRREEQPLGAPLRAAEAASLQLRERRVERLQRGDVRRPRFLDRERRNGPVEGATPGFHLGQLGHLVEPPG
jgi:hypothetical protein